MDDQNKVEPVGEVPHVLAEAEAPELDAGERAMVEGLRLLLKAAVATEGGLASYLRGESRVTGEGQVADGLPGMVRMGVLFDLAMTDFEFSWVLGPQYGQVRALYAQAMNASACPCGSGTPYGDCCKAAERLAGQAARAAVEKKQQAAKGGNGKTGPLSAAEAAARAVGSDWALVLYPGKDGVLRLESAMFKEGTSRREVVPMPLGQVADALTDMYHEAQQQITIQRVMNVLRPQQGGIQRPGSKLVKLNG